MQEQQTAENGIAAALEPLQPDEAMCAMIEVQAAMLATEGIQPRTPEFERFAAGYFARLSERTRTLYAAISAAAH